MTVRIIACRQDATAAANTNATVNYVYQTFDIQCPDLEVFLGYNPDHLIVASSVIGAHVLEDIE